MNAPPGPNPLQVAWSILNARRRRRPDPAGTGTVDHSALAPILDALRVRGVPGLVPVRDEILSYRDTLSSVDPDTLSRNEALAYWLNLYNAGALVAAADAAASQEPSVLRVPGVFGRDWAVVGGESLSLDDIEHGKVRRFGDPRVHGALVCGSASCPTLRFEPYAGTLLDAQLDAQMRAFLGSGGVVEDRTAGTVHLSRIFLWFGGDFTRPNRMPTWLPARKRSLLQAVLPWLSDETASWVRDARPNVAFQGYDWSLACTIA